MATISTHNGSAVRQAHNIRAQSCVAKEMHIDPNGIHEIWTHETIAEAYHRLFDDAVARYNTRQSRPERRIRNYHSDVLKDDRKHDCYEMIIGVYGDNVDDQTARQIMLDFAEGWDERNPNLDLIGAYYHADEQGKNPHVHLDYIPVAHGYTRGMDTQTGLVKALGEMGFHKHGKATAQIQWQTRENKELERICQQYGLTIEHPQAGKGAEHLDTKAFKAYQRAQEAEIVVTNAEQRLNDITAEVTAQEHQLASARQETLEALREHDKIKIGIDVQKAVSKATEPFRAMSMDIPTIIEETSAKPATIFSSAKPATVTITRESYESVVRDVKQLESVAAAAEDAANRMQAMALDYQESARTIHLNRLDAHTVAVDERVQALYSQLKTTHERLNESKALNKEFNKRLSKLQKQLDRFDNIIAFDPDYWASLEQRTKLALELERLYHAHQNGEYDTDVRFTLSGARFTLRSGQELGEKDLLDLYVKTCRDNNLKYDSDMVDRQKQLSQQYHNRQRYHEYDHEL